MLHFLIQYRNTPKNASFVDLKVKNFGNNGHIYCKRVAKGFTKITRRMGKDSRAVL